MEKTKEGRKKEREGEREERKKGGREGEREKGIFFPMSIIMQIKIIAYLSKTFQKHNLGSRCPS
jgi:hypothetical protein